MKPKICGDGKLFYLLFILISASTPFFTKGSEIKMNNEVLEKLLHHVTKLKQGLEVKQTKIFQVELLEHVITRLSSYSQNCTLCENNLKELYTLIEQLTKQNGQFQKRDLKEYRQLLRTITAHLQKEHKLVTPNYYMTLFMSLGMGVGVAFAFVMSWNIAMGVSFGILFGVVIGMLMDEDAKKKGLVI